MTEESVSIIVGALGIGWVVIIIGVIIWGIYFVKKDSTKKTTTKKPIITDYKVAAPRKIETPKYNYKAAYKPEYLLSINEKNQYWKLRQWADTNKLIVFTKVRLLDLISPRQSQRNHKSLLWKIQAKHVDFVICDMNIKVKCIVEIMDSSHNQPDRIERDRFVREVLASCGYHVIQTYNVNPETLDKVCGFYKEIRRGDQIATANRETENPGI